MVTVSIDGDRVRFEVESWDKLWALRSHLEIPLAHIKSARVDPDAARGWWVGLKLVGTNVPWLLNAGTFYQRDGIVFFDVHNPDNTIVVELDHETYKRLVIEVENPSEVVATIGRAIGR